MDDDNAKTDRSLIGPLGAYAELYPSLGPRLLEAERSVQPEVLKRVSALRAAFAAREGHLENRLARTYGLTPTEARITIHLAAGGSIAGYAELFGVSAGTVRGQLKSIFAKTGVDRQAALVALVSRP
jgi:DNA-binding CsgD family transcriptional regulator